MEKIIVEEPVFKTVQSRTKKVTKYKTSDGRIFDKEKDAISYELQLETVNKIKGIKKIFLENESTKKIDGANSGYGCFIAYEMAVGKCGWCLDAENVDSSGCVFTIKIKNEKESYGKIGYN